MYQIYIQEKAERFLSKLDNQLRKRIISKFEDLKINPKIGIPLVGNFAGLWKLRIGDYRAVYRIIDEKLVIVVIKIGHRKNVYD